MTDNERRQKIEAYIEAYIDDWMFKLNERAKQYQKAGMDPDVAIDRATFDVRMEIRRAPPVELP